jgi:ABC-type Fe3+/spermidine/putrescine transport system ATPase subunit
VDSATGGFRNFLFHIYGRHIKRFPPVAFPDVVFIGFVFQGNALIPHLTVFENIAYGLRFRKIKTQEINRRVNYYLNDVRLANEKNKFPCQSSGGQKQRVALARALIIEPEALLMDKPVSSLDVMTKETVLGELKSIQRKKMLPRFMLQIIRMRQFF